MVIPRYTFRKQQHHRVNGETDTRGDGAHQYVAETFLVFFYQRGQFLVYGAKPPLGTASGKPLIMVSVTQRFFRVKGAGRAWFTAA